MTFLTPNMLFVVRNRLSIFDNWHSYQVKVASLFLRTEYEKARTDETEIFTATNYFYSKLTDYFQL
ncbi:hypothetical protein GCM10011386_35020 [Parapedobacter defluvii]|uniref:Uncharacterized protein n=1 Tax=Parapedobacter defluvii TaxID=2045106 RepID=A0ABQ1MIZ5_9SPHI|nr:hypothetical protein GCM10011386_35020 [Parapedobacter defluvii]